jgi:hypothetical protein
MRELAAFFVIACLSGAVLLVSIVELIFTVRRRKVHESLERQLKELKAAYNESINKLVLEGDSKLTETEQQLEEVNGQTTAVKEQLEQDHAAEIKDLKEKSRKALEKAQERARALENEAKEQAGAYLEKRKKEVEEELMNMVITVVKKVLPDGITYEGHKELVAQALNDIKADKGSSS